MDFFDYVLIALGIVFVFFVFWFMIKVLRKISDRYVFKNRQSLFESDKKYYEKVSKIGKNLCNQYKDFQLYVEQFNLNRTIDCSNSIVSSSCQNPVKYLLKYSGIIPSQSDMERLEFIAKYLKDCNSFRIEMEEVGKRLRGELSLFHKIFANKELLPYVVCDVDTILLGVRKPYLRFYYLSPAGRSSNTNMIVVDASMISKVISVMSESISKKGHSKTQRNIMTNDLREAIKKRDNYTCCKCGNSVFDEPNLLLEVDHIVPVSKGGKTEASNLQTLCWRCNRLKSNKKD